MRKVKKLIGMVLGLSLMMLGGCSGQGTAKADIPTELTLSVAASLTDCMATLEEAFKEQYPNITLKMNFGASGALQQQIEQGAPVDLFISAGTKQVNALEEAGLLEAGTNENLLRNRLVLITPQNGEILTFKGLGEGTFSKLAVGEFESVPVGQYTREVLDTLEIYDEVEEKLVFAKDVREVLSWVESGNADAGVVYETDAMISDKVVISDVADESWHKPVMYAMGIIKDTTHLEETKLFTEFLGTEEAREIFASYGFTPAEKAE